MHSISTKTGDSGTTGLADGARYSKSAVVFKVLGSLDELNSWIGVIIANLRPGNSQMVKFLHDVQKGLFVMSGEIAHAPKCTFDKTLLDKIDRRIKNLEKIIDSTKMHKFIYPGGSQTAAWLDVARSVCRRCERRMVQYGEQNEINPVSIKTINRLSDYLYLCRCWINQQQEMKEELFNI